MKINFILPFKRMSGGIRVVYIYANYLAGWGHDVYCYLPMVSYKGKDQSIVFRVKASISNTIKKEKWFSCDFPVKVVPLIIPFFIRDADVTIATAWQTAYDVAKLPESKGRKLYFVQDYEIFNGTRAEVEGSYQLGIPMITISKELKRRLSFFSPDVQVVYNGLFDQEYMKEKKTKHEKPGIMLMYHEARHKGTEEGLKVAAELEKRGFPVQVTIFGRKIDRSFPERYKVYENPERKRLIKLYQKSDIYLFTSSIEAWGLPIVEAMANRCAVIGRRLGALDELYDGENAVIVNNYEEMLDAVIALLQDSDKLCTMQNAAYETSKRLNWKESALRFEQILKKEGASINDAYFKREPYENQKI